MHMFVKQEEKINYINLHNLLAFCEARIHQTAFIFKIRCRVDEVIGC